MARPAGGGRPPGDAVRGGPQGLRADGPQPRLTPAEVGALQERAARAQPASVEQRDGGDLLRRTDDADRWWTGASLLHGAGPLHARLDAVERVGGTCVQVCPACPPGLDDALAARGWHRSGDVHLLVAEAAAVPAPRLPVQVDGGAAAVVLDGDVAAVGHVVVDTGWAGVFGMRTRPEARRRGAAAAVLGALARAAGVPQLYLQVEAGAPALGLYAAAGFVRAATYHYRSR